MHWRGLRFSVSTGCPCGAKSNSMVWKFLIPEELIIVVVLHQDSSFFLRCRYAWDASATVFACNLATSVGSVV